LVGQPGPHRVGAVDDDLAHQLVVDLEHLRHGRVGGGEAHLRFEAGAM
jgi:hypothetical protein